MSSSNGLGQPSPGQPDFDGPQGGAPQPGSGTSAGWGPSGSPSGAALPPGGQSGNPSFGSAPTPVTPGPQTDGHDFPGPYVPGQASASGQGWPPQGQQPGPTQGQPYPPTQAYPSQPYPGQPYPSGQPYPPSSQPYGSPGYPPPAPGFGQPGQQPYGQPAYGQQAFGQQPFGQPGNQPATQSGYQPPTQPPSSRPSGSGRRGLILAGVVIAVLIVGLLGWQFFGPSASQQPSVTPSPATSAPASTRGTPLPTVTRATETPQPTITAPVTGGGIGQTIDFTTGNGTGKVTVAKATWADNGLLDPTEGQQYLIVDVTLEGVTGKVTTGPFFASVVDAAGDNHMLTIGAALDNQLAMRTLGPGQQSSGQIAFELKRGAVTFQLLDELLEPVAKVDIPG